MIGPRIFPCIQKVKPIPRPIVRSVPQKMESPIPDNGPINAVLIALIEDASKSRFVATSSSIATAIP